MSAQTKPRSARENNLIELKPSQLRNFSGKHLTDPHTWVIFDKEGGNLTGTKFTTVFDRSGNRNHFTAPATASQQPTLTDNVIGGKQGAYFQRSNFQYLYNNALHTPITAGAGIFVVVKELITAGGTRIDTYFLNQNINFSGLFAKESRYEFSVGGATGTAQSSITSTLTQPQQASILYGNWGTNAKLWLNNVQVATGSTQLGTISSAYIGRYFPGGTNYYYSEMMLCEIFIVDYGRDLYEKEIRAQYNYLNSKYNGVF